MVTRTNDPVAVRTSRLKTNGQGIWEIWFSEQDGGGDYKTRRQSCRTKDAGAAQEILERFRQHERQVAGGPAAFTVEDLCREWLEHVTPLGKGVTGGYVLTPVRRLLGRYQVDGLTDPVLTAYQRQRGVSAGSLRRELGALKTVLLWAAKKRLIERGALPEIELPPGEGPRVKFLDRDQEQWFWDQAMAWGQNGSGPMDGRGRNVGPVRTTPAYRVMLFVALGLETAARRGAIHDLTWDRVDLVRGVIDYRVPGRRVTKKRRVLVPISDRLMPLLRAAEGQAPRDVMGRPRGRVLGETWHIRDAFRLFTEAISMPWVTPHVLRHTWASLAAMNGVSLFDIAQVLGDTVATVEANYLHLTPGHLRRAINHKAQPAGGMTAPGLGATP